jgi:nitroreductase
MTGAAEKHGVAVGEDAPIFDVMRTMRAMRRLKDEPVPDELLDRLIEAATWAPSGSNAQQYSYVVVTDRGQMARLAELWDVVVTYYIATFGKVTPPGMDPERYARMVDTLRHQRDHFARTPAVIVPCYEGTYQSRVARRVKDLALATQALGPRHAGMLLRHAARAGAMAEAGSVYPGVQNLLLAARTLGLGAVITTWHLLLESEFKGVLGVPRGVKTFCVIPVGWPEGNFGPVKRKPIGDAIHRDRW